jgi:hypothetical protein
MEDINMPNNQKVEDILKKLEKVASAPVETETTSTENATPVTSSQDEEVIKQAEAEFAQLSDLEKVAYLADLEGRIAGQSFYETVEKLAVGDVGMTPDASPIENPAIQVPRDLGAMMSRLNPTQLAAVAQYVGQFFAPEVTGAPAIRSEGSTAIFPKGASAFEQLMDKIAQEN